MKIYTKDWKNKYDISQLKYIYQAEEGELLPIILGNDCSAVDKKDVHTIKLGNLNLSESEKEINFLFVKNSIVCITSIIEDIPLELKTANDDFKYQYANRLRVISLLPEEIKEQIKNKHLLALGYAGRELKKILNKFIKEIDKGLDLMWRDFEKNRETNFKITITNQLKDHYYNYPSEVFDHINIRKLYFQENDLYFDLGDESVILQNAKVIEEECKPEKTYIERSEIHQVPNGYELHLLIIKIDKNLMENMYYATYFFEDMWFKNS